MRSNNGIYDKRAYPENYIFFANDSWVTRLQETDIGFRSDNSTANGPLSNYLAELTGSPQVFGPWRWTELCVWAMGAWCEGRKKRKKKGEGILFLWKRPLITKPTRNPEQLQLVTFNLLGSTLYKYTTEKFVEPEREIWPSLLKNDFRKIINTVL